MVIDMLKTRKWRTIILFSTILLVSAMGSWDFNPPVARDSDVVIRPSNTNLKIVTTIAVPYDIVRNIVGSTSNINTIVSGTTDIHTFQGPTSEQLNQIYEADVIFAMGIEGAESWFWDDVALTNQSIVDKTVNLTSMADGYPDPLLEGSINPHVWMNPNIVKKMANITTTVLVNNDSANQATFIANNATFQGELDQLLGNIADNATILGGMKVVVNHPAFYYLLDLLGIERLAAVEEHEGGGEPGQAHINEIVQTMNEEGCKLILANPQQYPAEAIEIARAIEGCKIADMSAIPGEYTNWYTRYSVTDYISMIEYCMFSLKNPGNPPPEEFDLDALLIGLSIAGAAVGVVLILWYLQKKRQN